MKVAIGVSSRGIETALVWMGDISSLSLSLCFRIFLGGHSAGAHLAAALMVTDWSQYGMETVPFSGSVLLGGLFDLTPLKKMYCDDDLHLTP